MFFEKPCVNIYNLLEENVMMSEWLMTYLVNAWDIFFQWFFMTVLPSNKVPYHANAITFEHFTKELIK